VIFPSPWTSSKFHEHLFSVCVLNLCKSIYWLLYLHSFMGIIWLAFPFSRYRTKKLIRYHSGRRATLVLKLRFTRFRASTLT
jgi:hypothetical protein